ncbi:MAG TPA: hypothetical protein VGO07_03980 [Candidatus Saccharimonadales bacterium]|nr:hypothetical protein [Candidatus Saccharimonadales bacterium]
MTTLAVASLTVYLKSSAAAVPSQTTTEPANVAAAQPVYAAWPTRSNNVYGFSFNSPADWTASGDSKYDPKVSATRQEFGTSLMPNTGSSAVNIEVLDETLQTAETWYDQYYAQTPIKVSKTPGTLKGKQSILYDFVAPTYETKLYLFAVGSKTYVFSSVNESINTSTSADYWSNFDNIFNSLTIQK